MGEPVKPGWLKPCEWETANKVLVLGELVAFGGTAAAIFLDFPGTDWAKWCLYLAAAVAAGTLFSYATYRSAQGEMPLTGVSVRRIAQISQIASLEQKGGISFKWDRIADDASTVPIDLLGLPLKAKRKMLAIRIHDALPERDPAQVAQQLDQMTEEEINEFMLDTRTNESELNLNL